MDDAMHEPTTDEIMKAIETLAADPQYTKACKLDMLERIGVFVDEKAHEVEELS